MPQYFPRLKLYRCVQTSATETELPRLLEQQRKFLQEYKIRSSMQHIIQEYARSLLPTKSISDLVRQSQELSSDLIIINSHRTIRNLLIYHARRIREFRKLPYLVVLNPLILESYNLYLDSMASFLEIATKMPQTLEENEHFSSVVLADNIEAHSDLLPSLSKGFAEVRDLISDEETKRFLDQHLRERISMRLISQQHILLTRAISGQEPFELGGKYNGVIKPINIVEAVQRNVDVVNDMFLLKYDQTIPVKIVVSRPTPSYWSKEADLHTTPEHEEAIFPYLGNHLDYMLTEVLKNAFRSHIENSVKDPVVITISISDNPANLEIRIRDKGKGVPGNVLRHIFDYSFTTFESNEGDSFKTLNVPPGLAGNIVAGMGYGLPLLKNYIEIFNDGIEDQKSYEQVKGLLTIQTYPGWGTDVYMKTVGW